jgi:hypothetical protein
MVGDMSIGEPPSADEPTVIYGEDGCFETPGGEFWVHSDYGVVLVPVVVFERLDLVDVRSALVAAKAAGNESALEWYLTDEPEPWNYDDRARATTIRLISTPNPSR